MSFLSSRHDDYSAAQGTFRPQLTSLIDVMTILLVFLIKSFSVEGNLITPSEDLLLPLSESSKTPSLRPSVEITQQVLIADGRVVDSVNAIAARDSLLIPNLANWLSDIDGRPGPEGMQEIMIQADRDLPFDIVKRVMFTCSKSGVKDFTVLVLQEEQ
ncbi:MAG: ExbD/TolR family protein [Chitinivibrionales bacterium]